MCALWLTAALMVQMKNKKKKKSKSKRSKTEPVSLVDTAIPTQQPTPPPQSETPPARFVSSSDAKHAAKKHARHGASF